jgi:hypothetical protein
MGSPGAVLSARVKNNQSVSAEFLNRRLAVDLWFRKTTSWKPLWLNSSTGNFSEPPVLRSWGRLEEKNSTPILTALVLRSEEKEKITDPRVNNIRWEGRWALISQDERDIFSSAKLAVIPFESGTISIPLVKKPGSVKRENILKTELFTDWKWNGKSLIIKVDQKMFENTAGFLIEQ